MNSALENLSKKQLIGLLQTEQQAVRNYERRLAQKEQNERWLNQQIAQLKRMLFGQKRERFEGAADQIALPFEATVEQAQAQQQALTENITYTRKKQSRANHKGRLPLPDHLPVEEVEIYPEGDLSSMVCIGTEVTDQLELEPARFYIKRYIRYKYARKDSEGVLIGELPERVIDKGIPGPGLLATILTDKYVDHLPLYRQRQRFLRENIPIAASTLEGWAAQGMDRLEILWEHLLADTKIQGYLQADETPIKVLDSTRKGACHQGYYWVYHSPITRTVLLATSPPAGRRPPSGSWRILKATCRPTATRATKRSAPAPPWYIWPVGPMADGNSSAPSTTTASGQRSLWAGFKSYTRSSDRPERKN